MVEPDGTVVVTGTKRLSKGDAEAVRLAQAQGQAVVFANRHQWRHFQRNP